MIRKIEFDNFYSFKEKQVIDFTTTKKSGDIYYDTFDGKQVSKVMGIIGPNNSGKTNITKLFGFIKYFFTTTTRGGSELKDTGYKSYAFSDEKKTNIDIEFETDKNLFKYSVTLCQDKVYREKLMVRKLKKYSKYVLAFNRTNNDIKINKTIISGITKKGLSTLKDDVSVIAFVNANYNNDLIEEVSEYFSNYWTNVNEAGFIFTPEDRLSEVANIYNELPELKEKVEEVMKNFGLGIEGFKIKKDKKRIEVEAIHREGNRTYSLPFNYESRGTKSLFVDLLHVIICTDFHGTALIIDEIEMGLHPEAVNKIVQFINERFMEVKKQFIFASHTFDFLKKFDAQQVCLVEKDGNKSNIIRLDEFDVRTDDNYYSKYLSGAYGAYPDISL